MPPFKPRKKDKPFWETDEFRESISERIGYAMKRTGKALTVTRPWDKGKRVEESLDIGGPSMYTGLSSLSPAALGSALRAKFQEPDEPEEQQTFLISPYVPPGERPPQGSSFIPGLGYMQPVTFRPWEERSFGEKLTYPFDLIFHGTTGRVVAMMDQEDPYLTRFIGTGLRFVYELAAFAARANPLTLARDLWTSDEVREAKHNPDDPLSLHQTFNYSNAMLAYLSNDLEPLKTAWEAIPALNEVFYIEQEKGPLGFYDIRSRAVLDADEREAKLTPYIEGVEAALEAGIYGEYAQAHTPDFHITQVAIQNFNRDIQAEADTILERGLATRNVDVIEEAWKKRTQQLYETDYTHSATWITAPDGRERQEAMFRALAQYTLQKGEWPHPSEIRDLVWHFADPGTEFLYEAVLDPLNLIPAAIMEKIIRTPIHALKSGGRSVFALGTKLPVMGEALQWLGQASVVSAATKLGANTEFALEQIANASADVNEFGRLLDYAANPNAPPIPGRNLRVSVLERLIGKDGARIVFEPGEWGTWLETARDHLQSRKLRELIKQGVDLETAGRQAVEFAADPKNLPAIMAEHLEAMYVSARKIKGGPVDDSVSAWLLKQKPEWTPTLMAWGELSSKVRSAWIQLALPARPGFTAINALDTNFRMLLKGGSPFFDLNKVPREIGPAPQLSRRFLRPGALAGDTLEELQRGHTSLFRVFWDNFVPDKAKINWPPGSWRTRVGAIKDIFGGIAGNYIRGMTAVNAHLEYAAAARLYYGHFMDTTRVLDTMARKLLPTTTDPVLQRVVDDMWVSAGYDPVKLQALAERVLRGEVPPGLPIWSHLIPDGYLDNLSQLVGPGPARTVVTGIENDLYTLMKEHGELRQVDIDLVLDRWLRQAESGVDEILQNMEEVKGMGGAIEPNIDRPLNVDQELVDGLVEEPKAYEPPDLPEPDIREVDLDEDVILPVADTPAGLMRLQAQEGMIFSRTHIQPGIEMAAAHREMQDLWDLAYATRPGEDVAYYMSRVTNNHQLLIADTQKFMAEGWPGPTKVLESAEDWYRKYKWDTYFAVRADLYKVERKYLEEVTELLKARDYEEMARRFRENDFPSRLDILTEAGWVLEFDENGKLIRLGNHRAPRTFVGDQRRLTQFQLALEIDLRRPAQEQFEAPFIRAIKGKHPSDITFREAVQGLAHGPMPGKGTVVTTGGMEVPLNADQTRQMLEEGLITLPTGADLPALRVAELRDNFGNVLWRATGWGEEPRVNRRFQVGLPPEGWTTSAKRFADEVPMIEYVDDPRLFHVTTNRDAVLEQGIKSRSETSLTGLGSPTDEIKDLVSTTFSYEWAALIEDRLKLAVRVSRGEATIDDIINHFNAYESPLYGDWEKIGQTLGIPTRQVPDLEWEALWQYGVDEPPEVLYEIVQDLDAVANSLAEEYDFLTPGGIGLFGDFEDMKAIDPDQIELLNIAARENSTPRAGEDAFELAFNPDDVWVVTDEVRVAGREEVVWGLQNVFGYPDELVDDYMAFLDRRANAWSTLSGRPADEFFSSRNLRFMSADDAPVGSLTQFKYGDYFTTRSRLVLEEATKPHQQSMPAEQWRKAFRGSKQYPVSNEELKWLGLDEYLESRAGETVTREELLQFLDENDFELQEIILGELTQEERARHAELSNRFGHKFSTREVWRWASNNRERLYEVVSEAEVELGRKYTVRILDQKEIDIVVPPDFDSLEDYWDAFHHVDERMTVTELRDFVFSQPDYLEASADEVEEFLWLEKRIKEWNEARYPEYVMDSAPGTKVHFRNFLVTLPTRETPRELIREFDLAKAELDNTLYRLSDAQYEVEKIRKFLVDTEAANEALTAAGPDMTEAAIEQVKRNKLFMQEARADLAPAVEELERLQALAAEQLWTKSTLESRLYVHQRKMNWQFKVHFKHDNVLAFMRQTDRVFFSDDLGRDVLVFFIEEFQSDLHSNLFRYGTIDMDHLSILRAQRDRWLMKGKEFQNAMALGPLGDILDQALRQPNREAALEVLMDMAERRTFSHELISDATDGINEYWDIQHNLRKLAAEITAYEKKMADFPLKDDRWIEVSVIRAMEAAASSGADYFAWAPGNIQTRQWGSPAVRWYIDSTTGLVQLEWWRQLKPYETADPWLSSGTLVDQLVGETVKTDAHAMIHFYPDSNVPEEIVALTKQYVPHANVWEHEEMAEKIWDLIQKDIKEGKSVGAYANREGFYHVLYDRKVKKIVEKLAKRLGLKVEILDVPVSAVEKRLVFSEDPLSILDVPLPHREFSVIPTLTRVREELYVTVPSDILEFINDYGTARQRNVIQRTFREGRMNVFPMSELLDAEDISTLSYDELMDVFLDAIGGELVEEAKTAKVWAVHFGGPDVVETKWLSPDGTELNITAGYANKMDGAFIDFASREDLDAFTNLSPMTRDLVSDHDYLAPAEKIPDLKEGFRLFFGPGPVAEGPLLGQDLRSARELEVWLEWGLGLEKKETVYKNPVLEKWREQVHTLFQKGPHGSARGAINFEEDGFTTIYALSQPDASTAMHEFWHLFRRDLYETPEDLSVLERAFGVEGGEWTVEQEEKWVDQAMAYVLAGEAPDDELAEIFEKFRVWMAQTYHAADAAGLVDDIAPEVKNVMDRLLTSYHQVGELGNMPTEEGIRQLQEAWALVASHWQLDTDQYPNWKLYQERVQAHMNTLDPNGPQFRAVQQHYQRIEQEWKQILRAEGLRENGTWLLPHEAALPEGVQTYLGNSRDVQGQLQKLQDSLDELRMYMHGLAETGDWRVSFVPNEEQKDFLADWLQQATQHKGDIVETAMYGGELYDLSWDGAVPRTNKALIDYSDFTRFDKMMKSVYPFWMFPSRSLPFWAETFITDPKLLSWYSNYLQHSKGYAYQNGGVTSRGEQLPSLVGYIPIAGTPYWINPSAPLSFRYAMPPVKQRYDNDDPNASPGQQAVRWMYENGQMFGVNPGPWISMLAYGLNLLDENEHPPWSLIPQTSLIPPHYQRGFMSWINRTITDAPEMIDPEVGWKDFLIERRLLRNTLTRITSSSNLTVDQRRAMAETASRAINPQLREGNEDLMALWTDARDEIEQEDYYSGLIGYFTGIYPRAYTDADAQFQGLMGDINAVRMMINDEVKAEIFSPYADADQRYHAATAFAYDTPEGAIFDAYQDIRYTFSPSGEQLYDEERERLIAERWLENEQTQAYFAAKGQAYDNLYTKHAGVQIGSKAVSAAWDELFETLAHIENNPDYALARRSWLVGYKPDVLIEEHYRNWWWRHIQAAEPRWDPQEETYPEYQLRQEEFLSTLDQLLPHLVHRAVLGLAQLEDDVRTEEQLPEGLIERLSAETNRAGYEAWKRQNDSVYEALDFVWLKNYWDIYWQHLQDPNNPGKLLTGAKREQAERKFLEQFPETKPSTEQLTGWVLEMYPGKYTPDEIVRAISGRGVGDISARAGYGWEEAYKQAEEIWDILAQVGPGDRFEKFSEEFRATTDDDSWLDTWFDVSGRPEAYGNQDRFLEGYHALLETASKMGLAPPSDEAVAARVEAEELNDKYTAYLTGQYGDDIYNLIGEYFDLSSAERQAFRKFRGSDYNRVQNALDYAREFSRIYPQWAMYYRPEFYDGATYEPHLYLPAYKAEAERAIRENAEFRDLVLQRLGQNFYAIFDIPSSQRSASQKALVSQYYDLKEEYGATHPIWNEYYGE